MSDRLNVSLPNHPVWRVMALLFPKVLVGLVRTELADLEQFPDWASSSLVGPMTDLEAAFQDQSNLEYGMSPGQLVV